MTNAPYFPFYPSDWLSNENVSSMSLAGEGAYIRLLSVAWKEGSIPADRQKIVMLCKCHDGPFIDEAISCFTKHPRKADRLINKRMEIERHKMEEHRKLKKTAGMKGADKRWHNHDSAIVLPMVKNGSSSSSSPSLSIKNNIEVSMETWKWVNITDGDKADWKVAYPACDIERELLAMIEWIKANPAKGKKSNYRRFITNWLARSQDRGGGMASVSVKDAKVAAEKRVGGQRVRFEDKLTDDALALLPDIDAKWQSLFDANPLSVPDKDTYRMNILQAQYKPRL